MKNAYARKLRAARSAMAARQQMTALQMAKDAALLAAAEVFHMGPSRVPAFSAAFDAALHDIAKMTVGGHQGHGVHQDQAGPAAPADLRGAFHPLGGAVWVIA